MVKLDFIKWVLEYFKLFQNPFSLLFFKLGLLKTAEVKFKDENIDNFTVNKHNESILNGYVTVKSWECNLKADSFNSFMNQMKNVEDTVELDGVKFLINDSLIVVFEYFDDYYPYDLVSFNNRTVIDIGANIADTSLIFANQGATVYAFEPVPPIYDMALNNINLNPNLKDKIHLFNKAVSCSDSKLNIYYEGSGSSNYIESEKCFEVETISMKNVLESYDFEPDILKIDCEGCEYGIINNTDLSMFNEIILEYHDKISGKSHESIINSLKDMGFEVEIHPVFNESLDDLGIIYAYK